MKKKGLIPWRVSRGLNWEDKTYKLKIVGEQKSVIRKSLEFSKQISRKRDEPKTPGSSGKISPEPDNSFKTKPIANRVNTKNSSKYCSEFERFIRDIWGLFFLVSVQTHAAFVSMCSNVSSSRYTVTMCVYFFVLWMQGFSKPANQRARTSSGCVRACAG